MENLELIIILLAGVAFLAVLAQKINFPLPILLVLVGIVISLIPGLPTIELNPNLIFLIFLPPLLYAAAWTTSWHDFKTNIRPISLAAVGLVLFTTSAVAIAVHFLIPSFGWPESFVLGAIVSPPDAVAAAAVTKGLGLNKRILTLLEGESLVNDASGLIAYKYALIAVSTGNFIFWQASLSFVWVAGMGILVGLAMGYLMYFVHKHLTSEPITETVMTFLTPFTAYLIAEHFHFSGVLAVVACGIFLTSQSSIIFSNITRMKALAVWETVGFILNGVIFILLGLQLKKVLQEIEEYSFSTISVYGILISAVVIAIRFIWTFPAAYIPRLSKKVREKETSFSYKGVIIFSWAGMRGVVSMAAALALPLTFEDGRDFPNRDLIIFLTFCVIISTLIFQGLTLPVLIKWLKMPKYSAVAEEFEARLKIASASIVHIEENISFGSVSDEVLGQLKNKYEIKINRLQKTDLNMTNGELSRGEQVFNEFYEIQNSMIKVEREHIEKLRKEKKINEEVLRKIEQELDLEEARIHSEKHQE